MVNAIFLRSLVLGALMTLTIAQMPPPLPVAVSANATGASSDNATAAANMTAPANATAPIASMPAAPGAASTAPVVPVTGTMNADGQCVCNAPPVTPAVPAQAPSAPAPPPSTTDSTSTPPPASPAAPAGHTTTSNNETSAAALLSTPSNTCFLAMAAVAGLALAA